MSNIKYITHSAENADSRSTVLGENLEHLLISRKMDVTQLASEVGLSTANIHNIRRGVANPTLETINALANYFGLSIADLLESKLANQKDQEEYALVKLPLLVLDELEGFIKRQWNGKNIAISVPIHAKEMKRVAVTLNNNSFSPLYEKDTLFIVNFEIPQQDGDMVILRIDNSPFMIRKVFFLGEQIRIDSPIFSNSQTMVEDQNKAEIIGVIEKIIKER